MRPLLALLAVLAVALAAAPAAPVPRPKPKPYFPTAVGTEWVYQVTSHVAPDQPHTHEETRAVTSVTREDGAVIVRVDDREDGRVTPREEVGVSDRGVFRRRLSLNSTLAPPPCLLAFPLRPGESWTSEFTYCGRAYGWTRTARVPEPIEVPAGRFEAVRVDIERTCGYRSTGREWYARGVGLVKAEFVQPNGWSRTTLTRFTPGND